MPTYTLVVNGERRSFEAAADTPLLWVLRDVLSLTGTKYGCGIGLCRACTVHLDGAPVRACVTPVQSATGKEITTIEGLGTLETGLHPLQQAWIDEQVPQCGYCQSGQIMAAAALLASNDDPSDADIDAAMRGNVCRCGTYSRIRRGIKKAAMTMRAAAGEPISE